MKAADPDVHQRGSWIVALLGRHAHNPYRFIPPRTVRVTGPGSSCTRHWGLGDWSRSRGRRKARPPSSWFWAPASSSTALSCRSVREWCTRRLRGRGPLVPLVAFAATWCSLVPSSVQGPTSDGGGAMTRSFCLFL